MQVRPQPTTRSFLGVLQAPVDPHSDFIRAVSAEKWRDVCNLRVWFGRAKGREVDENGTAVFRQYQEAWVRYVNKVKPKMRIVVGDDVYGIEAMENVNRGNLWIKLTLVWLSN